MSRRLALEIICSLLILLFTYAAISKLLEYRLFQIQLSRDPYIAAFAPLLAWALPCVELLLVVALAVPVLRLSGLYLSLLLLAAFTCYITGALQFSDTIPCSCGGVISTLSWKQHIAFNLFFMVLSLTGVLLIKKPAFLQLSLPHKPTHP